MDVQNAHHTYTKRGIYYFSRRVPRDLKAHYKQSRISLSLGTKSQKVAGARARTLVAKLEEDWITLRWRTSSDPLRRFLVDHSAPDVALTSDAPTLSEAMDHYLRAKSKGRSVTFRQAAERSVGYLTGLLGDRPIDTYARADVNRFRDSLFERGLSAASVRRTFNNVRALINFAAREHGLPEIRSFSGVYLGEEQHQSESKRQTIPVDVITSIQAQCRQLDDEARWLIALISDSGMRLSEAVGLTKDDVHLSGTHPHLTLKAHPWRRLKTRGSERVIPLVGASLWAAQRATSTSQGDFLFPKYCSKDGCKANSASGALNKWLSARVPKGCVIHSFRHSIRDRLRAVECPSDMIDRIGGWSIASIGEGYGSGYPVAVVSKWMLKIQISAQKL